MWVFKELSILLWRGDNILATFVLLPVASIWDFSKLFRLPWRKLLVPKVNNLTKIMGQTIKKARLNIWWLPRQKIQKMPLKLKTIKQTAWNESNEFTGHHEQEGFDRRCRVSMDIEVSQSLWEFPFVGNLMSRIWNSSGNYPWHRPGLIGNQSTVEILLLGLFWIVVECVCE